MCTAPHTHAHVYIGVKEMAAATICIESDDDVVEPEVENEKTQSSIESFLAPLPAGQVPSPRPRTVRGATRMASVQKDIQMARR